MEPKFRDITKKGINTGKIEMTFERDTAKNIMLNPAPGAIKDGSPVWLWGYPVEYVPDGFEKPDMDELKNRVRTKTLGSLPLCGILFKQQAESLNGPKIDRDLDFPTGKIT